MELIRDISIQPLFPLSGVIGIAAIVIALTFLAYWRARLTASPRRRFLLALLRCVTVVGLAIVLLRPMRAESVAEPGIPPVFVVALDRSASMNTVDVDGKSRDEAVRDALDAAKDAFQDELGSRYDVRFYTFSDDLEPMQLDEYFAGRGPMGTTTDVATALLESGNVPPNQKLAGALIISDGRDNAGNDARRAALMLKGANAAVWTSVVGNTAETHDVYVTARLKQSYLFVEQPGAIAVAVSQTGFEGKYASVTLFREEQNVSTQQVVLNSGGAHVEFPVTEKQKGLIRYRIEVEPLQGESDVRNNKRTIFVRVADEKTKILLIEARPYWDSKFLLRTLQHDPNVELTSLFKINADKVLAIAETSTDDPGVKANVSQGVGLPRTKEDLYQYDCIILGKGVDALLDADQLALIRDFVRERGGGVVFSRGRSYGLDNEALAALEPLVWERDAVHGTRFELTPEGKGNPAFSFGKPASSDAIIRELPEMVSVTKVAQEKSLSVVLARSVTGSSGTEMATIAYQRYGKGKVMSVGATGLWRWSLMPKELSAYDDVYARFWGQMIRWLVSESDFLPGQEISFRSDQYSYNVGDTVQFTARTKFVDEQTFKPVVNVRTATGKEITFPLETDPANPSAYTARYLPDEEGEFVAELRGADQKEAVIEPARFTVYSDSIESRFVSADPELLSDIASITGGSTIPLTELDTLPAKVAAFERQTRSEAKPVDAWDTLVVFSALIAFLAAEWFGRRRSGLV